MDGAETDGGGGESNKLFAEISAGVFAVVWRSLGHCSLSLSFLQQNKSSLVPKMNFQGHMSCFTRG